MRQAKHAKKALLIISDGGDNHSREITGGRSFSMDNPNDLADIATKIGIECATNLCWLPS